MSIPRRFCRANKAPSVPLGTIRLVRVTNIYSHHMQSGDSWLSDWESQRRWRSARFWFRWRPRMRHESSDRRWAESHDDRGSAAGVRAADPPYPESSAWLSNLCQRRWHQVQTPHILQNRCCDETTHRHTSRNIIIIIIITQLGGLILQGNTNSFIIDSTVNLSCFTIAADRLIGADGTWYSSVSIFSHVVDHLWPLTVQLHKTQQWIK